MREMRDSGIELIGEIPKGWQTKALKYCADVIMGQSPDSRLITDYGTTPFLQGNREFGAVHPEPSLFCDFCPQYSRIGDILMSVRAPVGAINESDRLYGIGRGLCSIKAVNSHKKFLKYVLLNYKDDWRWFSNGSTFDAITTETLQSLLIPVPPIKEQQAIASYLDCKCAEIDTLTMDIEAQIKTLEQYKQSMITEAVTKGLNPDVEMKDSGIEWIGKIPQEWDLKKIKYCLQDRVEKNNPIKTKKILSLTAKQGVIPLEEKEGGGNKPKEDIRAYRLAYPGDIVMNSMNILSGSVGLSTYFGCVSPVYYMLRPQSKVEDVRYYNYIFQSTVFQHSLYGLGNGILIKESENGKLNTIRMRIPMDNFGQLFIPVAPCKEQKMIADFLDSKCTEIDSIIADKQTQLDTLAKYKKSLIYEYVTGKKEVPTV